MAGLDVAERLLLDARHSADSVEQARTDAAREERGLFALAREQELDARAGPVEAPKKEQVSWRQVGVGPQVQVLAAQSALVAREQQQQVPEQERRPQEPRVA